MDRTDLIVIPPEDHAVLGEAEFGQPGLLAIESVGPFTRIKACGPLITVHDSVIDAGLGIGHHPHRYNERLFYVERGSFDHDDSLNGISGHVPQGAMARFTEGRRGMIHQEWNHGDVDAVIYILVASTDPVPPETSFAVLERGDMPVATDAPGITTVEMVGPAAPLPITSDVHTFTDTRVDAGATVSWRIPAGDGGLLSVREGSLDVAGSTLEAKTTVLAAPAGEDRRVTLAARDGGRVIRATFGRGHGLVTG